MYITETQFNKQNILNKIKSSKKKQGQRKKDSDPTPMGHGEPQTQISCTMLLSLYFNYLFDNCISKDTCHPITAFQFSSKRPS